MYGSNDAYVVECAKGVDPGRARFDSRAISMPYDAKEVPEHL
jgi:hypothetical protein